MRKIPTASNADSDDLGFVRAYAENPDIAMKILFYARDIREGLGERRAFRTILKYLCDNHAASVRKNLPLIAEYGRYDDILCLMDTPCEKYAVEFLKNQLNQELSALEDDKMQVSLMAKWFPSVNTSNKEAVRLGRKLAKAFGMTEKEYRKALSALRKQIDIIENHLRETDYTFDYSKQCGKAMLKYRAAFLRHDQERYQDYLAQVSAGVKNLHTGTLCYVPLS